MASLSEIRAAVVATVSAGVPGLNVHAAVPDGVVVPALLVLPVETNFDRAFGRGLDEHQFDLIVLVSKAVAEVGQSRLDEYVTGAGPRSIREAIFADRALGLTDGTEAHVSGMSRYGQEFTVGGVTYSGAVLRLVAITNGTA
jgi:hypothetical protein